MAIEAAIAARSDSTAKQGWRIPPLLCARLRGRKWLRICPCLLVMSSLFVAALGHAIPPNTEIINTAEADYQVGGSGYTASDSLRLVTDPASGNSPPHGLSAAPASVDENLPGGSVGVLSVEDLDPADTHSFTVADPRFEVVGNELRLVAGQALDYEAEQVVTVTVTVTDSAGGVLVQDVVVTVNDVNEAPTAVALDDTTVVASQNGAIVGTLATVDPDNADTHAYTVDDPRFEVTGDQLKLIDGESLPLGASVTLQVTTTDSGGLTYVETFTVTVTPPGGGTGVNSSVGVYQWVQGISGAQPFDVAPTQCDAGAGLQDLPAPTNASGSVPGIPGTLDFLSTAVVKSGDAVFFLVTDPDANLDAGVVDRLSLVLSISPAESEVLVLAETGTDTGTFAGYIQSALAAPVANDCVLQATTNATLVATYTDANDSSDIAVLNVLVDPLGTVFDSASGTRINGAMVRLVDAASGADAVVFADDGVTQIPASQSSGDTGLGLSPGTYRFPFVAAGQYRLEVIPPNRFAFPSVVSDAALQLLPGAPYALQDGSRGLNFDVPVGPAIVIDLPLDVQPLQPSVSGLALFLAVPAGSGRAVAVAPTECSNGTTFADSGTPTTLAQGALALPGHFELGPATRVARGDAVFVQLTDLDQDLDPFAPDTVVVDISVAGQSDVERVRLTETNDSTGIFTGFVQTQANANAVTNDCAVQAPLGATLVVDYVDATDAQDTASASTLLDPGFTTFASSDGSLLDGASVTLIDASTGSPATGAVFSEDGTTPFPVTVVAGAQAVDSGGRTFDFASGSFYFPVIRSGTYRLQIDPPEFFAFPSMVADAALNALPTGPYVLSEGSRGLDFVVQDGVPPGFDIPLDPTNADLFISKLASKEVVAVGDFLQYQVRVQNSGTAAPATGAELIDTLPQGFRYAADSIRLVTIDALGPSAPAPIAEPNVASDGRQMRIPLPILNSGEALELRYVVEVTAGSKLGSARNRATVNGVSGRVNEAFADVLVREDLFLSKATVVGQIWTGECSDEARTPGPRGIRVWMEDGTFVVTDDHGKFHFEGVEPGSHVMQIDTATLPSDLELLACEDNTRFAGSTASQFVDVRPGTLWRTDFYVKHKDASESDVVTRLDAEGDVERREVRYHLRIQGGGIPLDNMLASVILDDGLSFVSGSATLNGQPKSDPHGAATGALTFRLPPTVEAFEYNLRFVAKVKTANVFSTRSVLQFASAGEKHRTEVNLNELSLNWPEAMDTIAESKEDFAPTLQGRSAANTAALDEARRSNVQALEGLQGGVADARGGDGGAPAPVRRVDIQGAVHEPGSGAQRARSNVGRVQFNGDPAEATQHAPYQLPELDRGRAPPFDRSWLSRQAADHSIVWPPEGYNPVMPAIKVAVVHDAQLRPQLLVDGKLVNALTYEGATRDHERGLSVSVWDGVPISERDSVIEAQLLDREGNSVEKLTRAVHYSGSPARGELVPEESHLVADGLYPPVVAVRLFDRAGYPLRPGTTGEFTVSSPYLALDKAKHLENSKSDFANERYKVLRDGIAYIQLEPTAMTGEVEIRFNFDQVRSERIRARLVPGARDWIMIGLAEGSYSKRDLSGNLASLEEVGLDDRTVTDGRVAFYAKGMVRGDWLLTAAYDTDKRFERELRQQIDPNQFYTLYGDGTQQLYDAQSQQKLFLRLEKERFAGLFGDYDTELSRAELTRYERRMNGVKFDYYGDKVEARVFAAETDQAFVRDELRGDGTSGVYRLSNGRVVRNSEVVKLVTRDRFSTEVIVEETALTRFVDYTIDYDVGSIIFKQPVFSQDDLFNPIFIEVEYEVEGTGASDDVIAGGRLAYRLDEQDSELAVTYVDDSTEGQQGDLAGVDFTWQFDEKRKVTVEAARSDTVLNGEADAYLVQFEHASEKLAGRVYARESEQNFGLGHQSSFESGTRKIGIEGQYRASEQLTIDAQAFEQALLEGGAERQVVDALAHYQLGRSVVKGGLRHVAEENSAGDALDATQILLGASRAFARNKLTLRADAEIDVGSSDNTDYPSRGILGAEYEVWSDVALIAEQELTWGAERDTQDTRFGVRARPWTGGDISSIVSRQHGENGERLFATTGLLQQWRVDDAWLFDVGFDRVQTLSERGALDTPEELLFNPAVPPASGTFNEDFTALFTGFGYTKDAWNVTSRFEYHQGDAADKWNVLAGANHQLAEGRVISSSLSVLKEETELGATNDSIDLRMGLAWRPDTSAWTYLNRTDLIFETRTDEVFDTRSRKWVNNFNANYKQPLGANQVSLQLGVKYVVDNIDDQEFDGITLLYGLEYRRDLGARWDVGVHGTVLESLESSVRDYSTGISVGHSVMKDMWISVGYNFLGFEDDDFVAADYTAKGPYLKLRLKFDQAVAKRFLEFAGLGQSRRMQASANSR